MCKKLLYDWTFPERSITSCDLLEFKAMFYVDCRHLTSKINEHDSTDPGYARDLIHAVYVQFFDAVSELTISTFSTWFLCNQKFILLILDHFENTEIRHMSLLMELETEDFKELTCLLATGHGECDRSKFQSHYFLNGFRGHSGLTFRNQFINIRLNKKQPRVMSNATYSLDTADDVISYICRSPLGLLLLSTVFDETRCDIMTSKCQLLKTLITTVISKYVDWDNEHHAEQCLPLTFNVMFDIAANLAYKMWLNNTFNMEITDMSDPMTSLPEGIGILQKHIFRSQLHRRYFVSFTNKYFRDFLVAQKIATDLIFQSQTLDDVGHILSEEKCNVLCVLIAGLLSENKNADMCKDFFRKLAHMNVLKYVSYVDNTSGEIVSRCQLRNLYLCLKCVSETRFASAPTVIISKSFPIVLDISIHSDRSFMIQNFIEICCQSSPPIRQMILHVNGMRDKIDILVPLANVFQQMPCLLSLTISSEYVDTILLVNFVLTIFMENSHIKQLTIIGPFNKADNIPEVTQRKITSILTGDIALRCLTLEHFTNHHRLEYILKLFPPILEKLEFKRSNMECCIPMFTSKISTGQRFSNLRIACCYIPIYQLNELMISLIHSASLKSIELSLLSSSKVFSICDYKKETFKSSIDISVCMKLRELLLTSTSLSDLSLCQASIDDEKMAIILDGVRNSGLDSLDLSGNVITDKSADMITDVILASKLTSLCLSNNQITAARRKRIIHDINDRAKFKLIM